MPVDDRSVSQQVAGAFQVRVCSGVRGRSRRRMRGWVGGGVRPAGGGAARLAAESARLAAESARLAAEFASVAVICQVWQGLSGDR